MAENYFTILVVEKIIFAVAMVASIVYTIIQHKR